MAKGNPGKRKPNKNEPRPTTEGIVPPDYLVGKSLEKWEELRPQLEAMGVLTVADVETLARYCTMYEQWRGYLKQVRDGHDVLIVRDDSGKVKYMQSTPAAVRLDKLSVSMLRIEQEFGLTPSARSSISGNQQNEKEINPLSKYLA
jgi:P27 family predicted phage terminase small subunit